MKKTFLILIMAMAAAAVFASGTQEDNDDGVIRLQPGRPDPAAFTENQEEVEITGTLNFDSPVPELVSGGKTYTLFAPGAMGFYGYLEEGKELSVKGYLLDEEAAALCMAGPARPGNNSRFEEGIAGADNVVFVETVELDGKTYELPQMAGGNRPGMNDSRVAGRFSEDNRRAPGFGSKGRAF